MSDGPETFVWLCLSALGAGAMNAIAGGGTLLTFPALLAVTPTSVIANATSTVALVPGSMAGAWAYRRELGDRLRWVGLLALPSLMGGAVGSLLVTRLHPKYFDALVPWLVLTAALLFLFQPLLSRKPKADGTPHAPTRKAVVGVVCFQFFVAVYGGYFGAGIGILMLSALGFMGLGDIHHLNAVKNFLAACINGVSVVIFIVDGKVVWPYVVAMAAAAVVGAYTGAKLARRIKPRLVRWIVVVIGFGLAAYFFWQRWGGGGG